MPDPILLTTWSFGQAANAAAWPGLVWPKFMDIMVAEVGRPGVSEKEPPPSTAANASLCVDGIVTLR